MFKEQNFYSKGVNVFLILVLYFGAAAVWGPKDMKYVSNLFTDTCLFLQSICGFLSIFFMLKTQYNLTHKGINMISSDEIEVNITSIQFKSSKISVAQKLGYIWFVIALLISIGAFIIDFNRTY